MAGKSKQRLKVFCTPVGFHDAYVAAPSQKAALEAWGAKTNLFAQGSARLVTDEQLTKAPLDHPGEIIKVVRGSDAEQLAALEQTPALAKNSSRASRSPEPERVKPRGPKPDRWKLTAAEDALEKLEQRQSAEERTLEEQERKLEEKREELQQRHEQQLQQAKDRIAEQRAGYERALRQWERD